MIWEDIAYMQKQQKRKVWLFIIILEILVLAGLCLNLIQARKQEKPLEVGLNQWSSNYINYENEKWMVEEGELPEGQVVDLIYGPYIELPKGDYTISIHYKCDEDQSFTPHVSGANEYCLIKGSADARMSKQQNTVKYDFRLTDAVDNFELIVKYNGNGNLKIENISITPNDNAQKRMLCMFVIVSLLFNIVLLKFKELKKERNVLLALGGIFFIASLPLFMPGIHSAHDINFHLTRIEGVAEGLKNMEFPVRMSSVFFDGYGYPVSIYYGDLLLYIPAVLRLFGFPVVGAYKIYILFVNIGTILLSYICFNKMFNNKKIALVTTLAYLTAAYRFINIYIRIAVGEYTAMMFLPVIALAIYLMYAETESNWKKNAFILAVGMTGLITCHILTTEMVVIALISVCILGWKKTFTKKTLITYVVAVVETILLNLWFLVPFLDYYLNVSVKINDVVSGDVKAIQGAGAFISQYFAFFQSSFGGGTVTTPISDRMMMTPGLLLMMTILVGIILWYQGKASKEIKWMSIASALSLFIASNIFPWNSLAASSSIGNFMAQVQFPWRYITVAVVCLTILLGFILVKNFSKEGVYIALAICIFTTFTFVSDYCNNANIVNFYDCEEIDVYNVGQGEYLRSGSSTQNIKPQLVWSEGIDKAKIKDKNSKGILFYCKTISGGEVELPLFNYKGYCAVDENDKELLIEDGGNNVIKVIVPENFEGNINVSFKSPWYWRIAECVSWLSLIIIIGVFFKTQMKKKRL